MFDFQTLAVFNALPRRILVTVHKDPDYDAIGSMLALGEFLKKNGCDVCLCSPDFSLNLFSDLPGAHSIVAAANGPYDMAIFLDCSDQERAALRYDFSMVESIVNIDHHQDNTMFGTINIVRNVSSVGELLLGIFNELKFAITLNIATCLYYAMCFDTGNFKFSNTTASTFLGAAQCLQAGVNAARISGEIFDQKSPEYFDDIRDGLNHMIVGKQHPYLIVNIPYRPTLSVENTVNFFRQYSAMEVVIVCKEIRPSEYRLNFRSRDAVNVAEIAKKLNGGGHIRAAGALVKQPWSRLLSSLELYMSEAFE
jgi:phosphoesterase RecJ-like protein